MFVCANHQRRKIITSCPSSTKLRRCPKFPSEAINWWAAARPGLGWPSAWCRPGEGHTGCGGVGGRAAADHHPSQRHRTLLHSYCPLHCLVPHLLQLLRQWSNTGTCGYFLLVTTHPTSPPGRWHCFTRSRLTQAGKIIKEPGNISHPPLHCHILQWSVLYSLYT